MVWRSAAERRIAAWPLLCSPLERRRSKLVRHASPAVRARPAQRSRFRCGRRRNRVASPGQPAQPTSSFRLWALDAEVVRADRGALNQAAGLPLPNRELREWVVADAEAAGFEAPSLNRVRKELQRWVHDQVLNEIGPIQPGAGNIDGQIGQIRAIVARIAPDSRDTDGAYRRTAGPPPQSSRTWGSSQYKASSNTLPRMAAPAIVAEMPNVEAIAPIAIDPIGVNPQVSM